MNVVMFQTMWGYACRVKIEIDFYGQCNVYDCRADSSDGRGNHRTVGEEND